MNRVPAAGPIDTDRADNEERFAGVAALVKRCVSALATASRWTRNYDFPKSHGETPFPILAPNGHAVMSDLSPLSAAKRKLGFGPVRAALDP
jgi:hypothetical protein